MAHIATNCRSFTQVKGSVAVIISQEIPVCSSLGKYCAFQVLTVTGTTGPGIALIEFCMPQVPSMIIDIVHAMWTIEGTRQAGMTGTAFTDGACVSLQLCSRQVII